MTNIPEPKYPELAMQGPENSGPPEPGSFAAGYAEGREDVLSSLAMGHKWAVDEFEKHKAKVAKIAEINALIDKERGRA